jgi:arylsulfatase A-like enzyme
MRFNVIFPLVSAVLILAGAVYAQPSGRNIVIFVADGLRAGSVNGTDAPTMLSLRQNGVYFANSHSMFPTFTMPNGSAIATGHYLGDTGTFSNALYAGYPIYNSGNFGNATGTQTPFIENDQVLGDIDDHFSATNFNYLTEETLLALARQNGYNTASVGKVGPAAIQDVTQTNPQSGLFVTPETVIIDDNTGKTNSAGNLLSPPLSSAIATALSNAGLATVTPSRSNGCGATDQCNNGFSGNNTTPGTTSANTIQQQYFADAVTKAILPTFVQGNKPFAIVFWSRDPDGSQHNQGDSLNKLTPGINGPTSKAAVANADNNLKQILDFLKTNNLLSNTDVFLTADHGFATISRHEIDAAGHFSKSYAAGFTYKNSSGVQEVNSGFLPPGFVAIDLAHALKLPLFDPDNQVLNSQNVLVYEPVDPTIAQQTSTVKQRPGSGDGLIGGTGAILNQTDAKVIVAANGGSDLIYVPVHNAATVKAIVSFLSTQDYVGGIFVDDAYGSIPGSLPLSAIGLKGNTSMPTPAVVLNFKTFAVDRSNPNQTAVQIADTGLQEGQGMHGTLSRDNTFNNMAAIGPDFKQGFVDNAPISNADISRTLAQVMGLTLPSAGHLQGRVLSEALAGGPASASSAVEVLHSAKAANKTWTVLKYQKITGGPNYFDAACFGNSTVCNF